MDRQSHYHVGAVSGWWIGMPASRVSRSERSGSGQAGLHHKPFVPVAWFVVGPLMNRNAWAMIEYATCKLCATTPCLT
jgi:hypothetical protein